MRLTKLSLNAWIQVPAAIGRAFPPPWLIRYGFATACVLGAFAIRYALAPTLEFRLPLLLFIPAGLLGAWHGGIGPGLFALVLGFLLGDGFFMPPPFIIGVYEPAEWAETLTYFCTAAVGVAAIENLHQARQRLRTIRDYANQLQRESEERRRVAESLRESEERFRLLMDEAKDYAILTLDPSGRITTWNGGAQRLNGYESAEIVGRHFSRFYPAEDVRQGKPGLALQRAAAEGRFEDEGWRVRQNGSRFCADVVITALHDKSGGLIGFSKLVRDVTARHQAEEELRATREQLARHASNLEAEVAARTERLQESIHSLEAVLYHVAHDLRAPLRAMEGFTQMLLENLAPHLQAVDRDHGDRIIAAAHRMDELIRDLLAYGRLTYMDVPCRRVALEKLFARVLAQLDREIKSRRAEITVNRPLPLVQANPAILDEMLRHLLANALKFVDPRSQPRIQVGAENARSQVRIWIQDNGIGVEPAHRERIFHLFGRLHGPDAYAGTGIGLAIVRKGAERMGGVVGVDSTPGQGSRFWVELPKPSVTE